MKRYLTLFTFALGAFLFLFLSLSSTKVLLNDCGITVTKSYNQQVLGKNIGFFVVFKNNTTRSLDAIEYKVIYKNGFDDVKGTRLFTWQAGNFLGPKLPFGFLLGLNIPLTLKALYYNSISSFNLNLAKRSNSL